MTINDMQQIKKEYYELYLPVAGFDTDALSGFLHWAGCLGIQEPENGSWIVYLPGNWSPEHVQKLLLSLKQFNNAFEISGVLLEKLPYRDWNAEWRKYFEPFEAIEKCWIRPPWQELPENAAGEEIIIDPQMAFGTGHHETTRVVMKAVGKLPLENSSILDLGTGSGILAIYGKKLGAKRVTAVDIDPDAIDNAKHNAELNNVDGIDFRVGDISLAEGKSYAIILANIQFDILINLPLQLYHLLEKDGRLIISGILKEDVARISYIYKQAGFLMADQLNLNEWAAITWEKR